MASDGRSDDQSAVGGKGTGPNPTGRGKSGTKRSLLTEGKGVPLAVVVGKANRHDMKLAESTLEAITIERPEPTEEAPQNLGLDKGYEYPQVKNLTPLRSLTSPEGLTDPMALRNPMPTPWPGRRIAPLSPLKGAYPLQTTPNISEFLRNSEMSGYRVRRWVVERTHSWLNRFRWLLTRLGEEG